MNSGNLFLSFCISTTVRYFFVLLCNNKVFFQLQETAKDTLKKLVDEKLETVKRMSDIERSLSNTEDEYSTLKELYDREVEENRKLAEEISRLIRNQIAIQ